MRQAKSSCVSTIFLISRCSDLLICDIPPAVKSFLLLHYLRRKTSKLIFVSVRRISAATSCPLRRGRLIPGGLMKDHSRCFSLWKSTSGVTLQHFLPLSVCVCDRPVCLELAVDDRLALRHCRCLWKERVKENRQRKKNERETKRRQTNEVVYLL